MSGEQKAFAIFLLYIAAIVILIMAGSVLR